MLFLVQLLQVHEGVLVLRVEAQDLVKGFESTVDESSSLVVEPQTEQDVRVLQLAETRAL